MAAGKSFTIATNTATLGVFDPTAGRPYSNHRFHDWWTMWEYALPATNAGEVAVIDLGADGTYTVQVFVGDCTAPAQRLEIELWCPTETLYVGPGEDIPADGLEPDETCGGRVIPVGCPRVRCLLWASGEMSVSLAVSPLGTEPRNFFSEPLRLRPEIELGESG